MTVTLTFTFDPSEPRDDHGRWSDGGGDGDSPATTAVRGLGGNYHDGAAQPSWEDAKATVEAAVAADRANRQGDHPELNAATTTIDHPDTYYHSSKTTNRDSIAATGLEAGRSLGGRRTRIYLDSMKDPPIPRSDTAPRDYYEVNVKGLPLRPDPELPGRWAISETDIPPDRLKLVATTHPAGMP